jgi:hypothetical protein
VIEGEGRPTFDASRVRSASTVVPLAVWRDGAVVPIADFDDLRHGRACPNAGGVAGTFPA